MPDVAELLSELEDLSERPPAAPRPVAEIRQQARRRRHRRRRTGLAAAGLVVVAAVGVLALRSGDSGGADVDTGPVATPSDPDAAPPTTVDDTGVVRVLEGRGLTLDPAEGLDDGDRVTLTLTTDPGGPVEVTQCAAEVVGSAGSLDPAAAVWCGSTFYLRDAAGVPDMGFDVARRLGTANGAVDCAEVPGRCVLVARPMTPSSPERSTSGEAGAADAGARRYAPLVFRDDLGPVTGLRARLVDVDGPVEDGRVIRLEVSGYGPMGDVIVAQCTGPTEELRSDVATFLRTVLPERCDAVREVRAIMGRAGALVADIRVFHDIGFADPDNPSRAATWTSCTPCSLVVVGAAALEPVVLPLELEPTDDPIRPVLEVTPAGPHQVGQVLHIRGAGFQVDTEVKAGVCPTTTPPGAVVTCSFGSATTDASGAFVIDRYPLGILETDIARCGDGPGACSIRWYRDGIPVGADVPLDVSG